jgi:amidase
MADTIFSSLTRLATAIRAGQISAAEVLEAHLAQIAIHNPALNAVTTIDAGKAQEQARAADAALARDEIWGPLHGVPFTLKDAHSTAGMPTTVGFPPLAGHVPAEDSTVTARLKQAGGVLIGKTNVPTMLGDFQTNNPAFGTAQNSAKPARSESVELNAGTF